MKIRFDHWPRSRSARAMRGFATRCLSLFVVNQIPAHVCEGLSCCSRSEFCSQHIHSKGFDLHCISIAKLPKMPNFFREVLCPLIFAKSRRGKLCLITWLQRNRLLKRNVNCGNCRNAIRLIRHLLNGDGYIW